MLEQVVEAKALPVVAVGLEDLIEKVIADLKPSLKRDGGDIELIAVEGDTVMVDLKGNCSGCVLASVTLAGIRKRLIEAVGRPLKVVPVSAFRDGARP